MNRENQQTQKSAIQAKFLSSDPPKPCDQIHEMKTLKLIPDDFSFDEQRRRIWFFLFFDVKNSVVVYECEFGRLRDDRNRYQVIFELPKEVFYVRNRASLHTLLEMTKYNLTLVNGLESSFIKESGVEIVMK